MVQIKIGDVIVMDPVDVIDNVCIFHFKNLIGPELIINENVLKARQEYYNIVGCTIIFIKSWMLILKKLR